MVAAREQFGLSGELRSDSASVLPLTRAVRNLSGLRFMRDPTRGGLATVAHELRQPLGAIEAALGVMRVRPERAVGERARQTVQLKFKSM